MVTLCDKAFMLAQKNLSKNKLGHSEEDRLNFLRMRSRMSLVGGKALESKEREELNKLKLRAIYDIKREKDALEVFEKLEKAVKKRIKQIKDLNNPYRCVLVIGGNDALIKGVVSYLYYKHTYKILYCEDCLGWDENRIKRELLEEGQSIYKTIYGSNSFFSERVFSGHKYKLQEFLNGNTLFLRDLEGKNSLKQLAGIIRNRATGEHGMLIISIPSADNLPEEFIRLSDIIELEPNKQNETINTSQINSDFERKGAPVFIYNKQGRSLTFNGHRMKLSEKRERLLKALKKPKKVRRILKIFYKQTVERTDKTRTKRGAFDKFTCSFNKKWQETFALSGELIKCEDEIVSIAQIIKW